MPFWSRQCWCWRLWASWCSNRTTRFSLGFYFLGRGPSGDGATSGVGETMNVIGGARLASGQKLVGELCSAQDQNVQTRRVGKGLASAVTSNTKSVAAAEDQAKSSVSVDATLPPGF